MLFLDESALTIGPNSEVVLDEFVYDPNTKTGKLVLTATKGLFRLVGGRISKTNPVILKTPTATIGIRGGIAMVNADAGGGATTSTFLFGDRMDVTSGGVTKTATRPGFTITVTAPNVPPSDPVVATPDQLSGALSSLEGTNEPAGDNENAPTGQRVAASGLSGQGSANQPNAMRTRSGRPQARTRANRQSAVSRKAEGGAEKNQMSQQVGSVTRAAEPRRRVSAGYTNISGCLWHRTSGPTTITQVLQFHFRMGRFRPARSASSSLRF